jgi:hypothetical protein
VLCADFRVLNRSMNAPSLLRCPLAGSFVSAEGQVDLQERDQQDMRFASQRSAIHRGLAAAIASTEFLQASASLLLVEPLLAYSGIQLYTVDQEMKIDIHGTLNALNQIGHKEVGGAGFAGLNTASGVAAIPCLGEGSAFVSSGTTTASTFQCSNAVMTHSVSTRKAHSFPRKTRRPRVPALVEDL